MTDDDDSWDVEPCPSCGRDIIDGADICPHCGDSVIRQHKPGKAWIAVTGVLVVGLLVAAYFH